jgi:hypothetical protein
MAHDLLQREKRKEKFDETIFFRPILLAAIRLRLLFTLPSRSAQQPNETASWTVL